MSDKQEQDQKLDVKPVTPRPDSPPPIYKHGRLKTAKEMQERVVSLSGLDLTVQEQKLVVEQPIVNVGTQGHIDQFVHLKPALIERIKAALCQYREIQPELSRIFNVQTNAVEAELDGILKELG